MCTTDAPPARERRAAVGTANPSRMGTAALPVCPTSNATPVVSPAEYRAAAAGFTRRTLLCLRLARSACTKPACTAVLAHRGATRATAAEDRDPPPPFAAESVLASTWSHNASQSDTSATPSAVAGRRRARSARCDMAASPHTSLVRERGGALKQGWLLMGGLFEALTVRQQGQRLLP